MVVNGEQLGASLGGGMGKAGVQGELVDGTSSTIYGSLVNTVNSGSVWGPNFSVVGSNSTGPLQLSLLPETGERQHRFFYRDSITWLEFGSALNEQLCDAFESGLEVTVVVAGDGTRYEVDFRQLTQKNVATGFVRSICWEDVGTGIRVGCDQAFDLRNEYASVVGGAGHISLLPRNSFHGMQLWRPNFDPFQKYGRHSGTSDMASSLSVVPWRRNSLDYLSTGASLGGTVGKSAPQAPPFASKAKDFLANSETKSPFWIVVASMMS